jgi:phosphatidylinositol glycan class B
MTTGLKLRMILRDIYLNILTDKIFAPKLALAFALSLLVHLFASFSSEGFMQHDEHYQVLEYASYQLGHTNASELPMEFQEKMRSWLLPAVVYGLFSVLKFVGLQDPFGLAIALRIFVGFFSCLVFWIGAVATIRLLKFSQIKAYVPMIFLATWFVPFLQVRPSSDNLSTQFFLLALFTQMLFYPELFRFERQRQESRCLYLPDLLTGVFLGLAIVLRFHVLFLIGTFAVWLIVTKKFSFPKFLLIACGLLISGLLGYAVDSWGYGTPVFSLANYLSFSFSSHVQSSILPAPWYQYFKYMLVRGVPPLGVIYVLALLGLGWRNRQHWLFWFFIAYVGVHSLIGHKEIRYLYPLYLMAPLTLSLWLDSQMERGKSYKQLTLTFFFFLSFLVQAVSIVRPANNAVPFYRQMQEKLPPNIIIEYQGEHPFEMVGYLARFYLWRADLAFLKQEVYPEIYGDGERFFFSRTGAEYLSYADNKDCQPLVTNINPQFLKYNWFDWIKRSRIWAIWKCQQNGA